MRAGGPSTRGRRWQPVGPNVQASASACHRACVWGPPGKRQRVGGRTRIVRETLFSRLAVLVAKGERECSRLCSSCALAAPFLQAGKKTTQYVPQKGTAVYGDEPRHAPVPLAAALLRRVVRPCGPDGDGESEQLEHPREQPTRRPPPIRRHVRWRVHWSSRRLLMADARRRLEAVRLVLHEAARLTAGRGLHLPTLHTPHHRRNDTPLQLREGSHTS